ncbi:MAG: hypothetical protein ACHQ9S_14150 [Candidatus Binatia bacterium]
MQTRFEFVVGELSHLEDWFTPKRAKMLDQQHAGYDLCEIPFGLKRTEREPSGKRTEVKLKCRPVGFILRPPVSVDGKLVPGDFVFLTACTKGQGRTNIQSDTFDHAVILKQDFDLGKGTTHDFDL